MTNLDKPVRAFRTNRNRGMFPHTVSQRIRCAVVAPNAGHDHRRIFPNPSFGRRGLTLVELMVALALTLFMMALFITIVVWAASGTRTMKGITAIDQKVRAAVTILKRDLDHVYLANSGSRISVGELFTVSPAGLPRVPDAGYFTIEENSRALRQGIDAWEQPIEIDIDDVLAFTVQLSGTKPDEIFYGHVSHRDAISGNAIVNGIVFDLGEYLDNETRLPPVARFDLANNFLVTTKNAEVVYYLRPAGRQYTPNDLIAADPTRTDGTPGNTVPPQPATFNLIRRQLLVLDSDDAQNLSRTGVLTGDEDADAIRDGIPLALYEPFYDRFDVSASREFLATPAGTIWTFGAPPSARIRFHSLADLSKREYRYGMRLLQFDNPAHPANGGVSPLASLYCYRAAPLSHVDIAATAPFNLHDYYRQNANELWFGRPTLWESAHADDPSVSTDAAFPFWPPPGSPQVSLNDANQDGVIDEYGAALSPGQRAGEDILLTNVVSFDVKVLEDFPGVSAAGNPQRDFDFTAAPFSAPSTISVLPRQRRPEFVDLGYYADSTAPISIFTGDYRNTTRVTTPPPAANLLHYIGHPTFAPFGVLIRNDFEPPYPISAASTNPNFILLSYGPDGKPGRAGFDDDANTIIDDASEYMSAGSDDYALADLAAYILRLKGPDGQWGAAGVNDDADSPSPPEPPVDEFDEYPWVDPANPKLWRDKVDDLSPFLNPLAGSSLVVGTPIGWGTASTNDDNAPPVANNPLDDIQEYLFGGAGATDDVAFNGLDPATTAYGVLFGRSGQVATAPEDPAAVAALTPLWNPGNTNPRNTYDSWSADYTSNAASAFYSPSPVMNGESRDAFRPVPYPRPIKAIQIKLRVLEPNSGIVREVTIVHKFN